MGRLNRAFTLFEVMIGLMLVTVASISVLMLLPMGVKAQQMARYHLYASTKANELVETYSQCIADFNQNQSSSAFQLSVNWPYRYGQGIHGMDLVSKSIYGSLGQFDIERIVVNANDGNYPIPLAIARRLDSPGDEIQNVLDAGGHIYYCDPIPAKSAGNGLKTLGAVSDSSPELQRMVWAVVGFPQQDILPMDPLEQPISEMWPFPPAGRDRTIPRYHEVGLRYEFMGNPPPPKRSMFEPVAPYATAAIPVQTWDGNMKVNGAGQLYQMNTWEMYARADRESGSAGPWENGIHEMRRLSHLHWGRIIHQLKGYEQRSPSLVVKAPQGFTLPLKFVSGRWLANGTYEEPWAWFDAMDQYVCPRNYVPLSKPMIGIPAPAVGLPMSVYRGTDILYEDHETWNNTDPSNPDLGIHGQIRLGMPSLQRRVMYRTAALALWAKVQSPAGIPQPPGFSSGPIAIHSAPAGNLGANPAADPNVADLIGNLPDAQNPLLGIIDPPNPAHIHPAQVLALNYLAHAAMMVTGYKPPFVDTKWNNDASDDVSVQPADPTLPFKALEATDSYLYDLWESASKPRTPSASTPGFAGQAYSGNKPLTLADFSTNPNWFEKSNAAVPQPIVYRRMVGPILNPNPPPYADQGGFDPAGRSDPNAWKMVAGAGATLLRKWSGDGFYTTLTDTQMARNAHETCLRWGMAYISENPYDFVVPRPMNRQTMVDQPMFCFDLFDTSGKADRTIGTIAWSAEPKQAAVGTSAPFYPTIWGSHRFLPNFYYNWIGSDDSYLEWAVERAWFYPPAPAPKPNGNWSDRSGYFEWGNVKTTEPKYPVEWGAPYYRNDNAPAIAHHDGFGIGTSNGKVMHPRYSPGPQFMVYDRKDLHGQAKPGDSITSLTMPTVESKNDRGDRFWYNDPFKPADRARQLVFWAVDWKSYEDSESAACAPQDWSMHGRLYDGWDVVSWMNGRVGGFSSLGRLCGNPEQDFVWMQPERDGTMTRPPPTAVDPNIPGMQGDVYDSRHPGIWYARQPLYSAINLEQWSPYVAVGLWGADRNHNGRFDRGPIPTAMRMRASEIARFNYYDPIAWTTLRR
ncbi:MAG: hypothetical protein H0V44_11495 [Planctomycetes bacterium]|nr:hypothetical protein [Planctomycetota bacterium]